MGLYEELKADADALLQELGQPMELVQLGANQSYNPVTGQTSAAADTLVAAYGVVIDYTAQETDGTAIQAGDKRVIMQAVEAPKPTDRLRIGTAPDWTIVSWKEVSPAGVALIYELQVRR